MIESIQFRGFRILEDTGLKLGAFNLLLGPNGSGKTTALRALVVIGQAARSFIAGDPPEHEPDLAGAMLKVNFSGALAGATATLAFEPEGRPVLTIDGDKTGDVARWLAGVHSYVLNPVALARPVAPGTSPIMEPDGTGLPAVLAALKEKGAGPWTEFLAEVKRLLPEICDVEPGTTNDGRMCFTVATANGLRLRPGNLSQGTLVIVALVALSIDGARPSLLCFEEIERGIHPRLLRDLRDTLYRLSFPEDRNDPGKPVQVVVTTHSPYLLDLFADNPEDVILAAREGGSAHFNRLADVPELAGMLESGRLGDLWYSGILGGVL